MAEEMESKFLMVTTITGLSSNKKSEVAHKLAWFLQYPLIDEDYIIPCFQNSIPSSSTESKNLAFEIASQISSIQLDLKLRCIINTPLSKSTQFHHLMQLASSKMASLIIIECATPNALAPAWYSVIGKVAKLSIDITKTFKVEDFVPKMLQVAEADKLSKGSSSAKQLSGDDTIVGRNFIDRHAQEFYFIAEPEIAGFDKLPCSNCKKLISGGTYKCLQCDDTLDVKAHLTSPATNQPSWFVMISI
ncbi:hypothetical protein P3X46_010774 [Hevea brasiliensis]|uniref:Uncharacterized protein n=1 Tax=Hevea brasiliensis TaxID=3981 RepID=A0ABQ9MJ65_HEVBR|nr:hypothetical protein P3X46_010774 [Hevea brasiliensis]